MIVESYYIVGTTGDILAAPSRMSSIPYNGTLIIEAQASDNDTTNTMSMTIQLSDGSTPLENVRIPKGVTADGLNMDDKYQVSFPVTQGGHVLASITETGTCTALVRVTLMP